MHPALAYRNVRGASLRASMTPTMIAFDETEIKMTDCAYDG
jgi:hypothetical protein